MYPTEVKDPFNKKGWIFEGKYDGYRALVEVKDGQVNIFSRDLKDYRKFNRAIYDKILPDLQTIKTDTIVDGEIVLWKGTHCGHRDQDGQEVICWETNFSGFATRKYDNIEGDSPLETTYQELRFHPFDVLSVEGYNVIPEPLLVRKIILAGIPFTRPRIQRVEYVKDREIEFFIDKVRSFDLEGMVAKNGDSPYIPPQSSTEKTEEWKKIKHLDRPYWNKPPHERKRDWNKLLENIDKEL